jgi:DNA mismatch repair protein MSH3
MSTFSVGNSPSSTDRPNFHSYVDDSSLNDDDLLTDPAPSTNAFVCITESNAGGNGTDDQVRISMLGIVIGTGDVTYDDFKDTHLRNELEVCGEVVW